MDAAGYKLVGTGGLGMVGRWMRQRPLLPLLPAVVGGTFAVVAFAALPVAASWLPRWLSLLPRVPSSDDAILCAFL